MKRKHEEGIYVYLSSRGYNMQQTEVGSLHTRLMCVSEVDSVNSTHIS
jgi:hypothetical protein